MLAKVFTGPNKVQLEQIKKRENIQKEYMDFVYNNPNLTIEEYKNKYKSLNTTTL